MKKFPSLRSQKGMTLVELVMVMVILVILAAISIPMFISYMPTMRLNGAASNLQMAVALTRMKAVSHNRQISLLLDPPAFGTPPVKYPYFYQRQNPITNVWENDITKDNPVTPTDLASLGITINTTYASKRIIFNSRGACVDTGGNPADGTVTITNNKGKTRTITVTGITGAIKLN